MTAPYHGRLGGAATRRAEVGRGRVSRSICIAPTVKNSAAVTRLWMAVAAGAAERPPMPPAVAGSGVLESGVIGTGACAVWRDPPAAGDVGADVFQLDGVRVELDRDAAVIRVAVAMTAVTQLFYGGNPDGFQISTNPALLRGATSGLDERALYSLLQFGAVVPPLSLWRDVRRFTPGHQFTLSLNDLTVTGRAADQWRPKPPGADGGPA